MPLKLRSFCSRFTLALVAVWSSVALTGLSALVKPIRHQKPSRLSPEQQQQLKAMVLTQRPIMDTITTYGRELSYRKSLLNASRCS